MKGKYADGFDEIFISYINMKINNVMNDIGYIYIEVLFLPLLSLHFCLLTTKNAIITTSVITLDDYHID